MHLLEEHGQMKMLDSMASYLNGKKVKLQALLFNSEHTVTIKPINQLLYSYVSQTAKARDRSPLPPGNHTLQRLQHWVNSPIMEKLSCNINLQELWVAQYGNVKVGDFPERLNIPG